MHAREETTDALDLGGSVRALPLFERGDSHLLAQAGSPVERSFCIDSPSSILRHRRRPPPPPRRRPQRTRSHHLCGRRRPPTPAVALASTGPEIAPSDRTQPAVLPDLSHNREPSDGDAHILQRADMIMEDDQATLAGMPQAYNRDNL